MVIGTSEVTCLPVSTEVRTGSVCAESAGVLGVSSPGAQRVAALVSRSRSLSFLTCQGLDHSAGLLGYHWKAVAQDESLGWKMKLERPRLSLVKENELGLQCGCRGNRYKGDCPWCKQVLTSKFSLYDKPY